MNELKLDEFLNEVLYEAANPAAPQGLERRIAERIETERGLTMSVTTLRQREQVEAALPGFGIGVAEQGLLASLWNSVRDLVSPSRQPELVLESRPVAVRTTWDQMRAGRTARGTWTAMAVHAAAILLIAFAVSQKVGLLETHKTVTVLDAPLDIPLPPKTLASGGGGGQKGAAPVSKGELPKIAAEQIVPPKAPPLQQPKIAIEPSVVAQTDLKMAKTDLPNIGLPNSPLLGTSMGSGGNGGGLGSGMGNGIGPGRGGNMGGGVYRIGGGVSAPVVIFQPEPEFSEEARKAKTGGNVLVALIVDEHGTPRSVRVVRGIGMGLDDKAVAAVRSYRFKPAMKDGKPVSVEMNVEVNFQIF